MSDAIKKLHDYLAKSPSVVYPEDALAYLPAIEDENARLRELLAEVYPCAKAYLQEWLVAGGIDSKSYDWYLRLRELGVEVDG